MQKILSLIFALLASPAFPAIGQERVTVCIDSFPPYVEPNIYGGGDATRRVSVVLHSLGYEVDYEYMPWNYCYYRIWQGEEIISYPWLETEARLETGIAFTNPIYFADVNLYFSQGNREARSLASAWSAYVEREGIEFPPPITEWQQDTIPSEMGVDGFTQFLDFVVDEQSELCGNTGQVCPITVGINTGYEYGLQLDETIAALRRLDYPRDVVRLVPYDTENELIDAFLNQEVDFFLMMDRVLGRLITADYQSQSLLFSRVVVGDIKQAARILLPGNNFGDEFAERFNATFAELENIEALRPISPDTGIGALPPVASGDVERNLRPVARISAPDNEPIVLANVVGSQLDLPLLVGTGVLVLNWADSLQPECFAQGQPVDREDSEDGPTCQYRLYPIMSDRSTVIVLDGPFVGREVEVANMNLVLGE